MPECGSWSSGADDRGIACFSARDADLPHSLTPTRPAPREALPPSVATPISVVLPTAPAPEPAIAPTPAVVPAPAPVAAPTPAPALAPATTPAALLDPPPSAPPPPSTELPVFIFPSPEPTMGVPVFVFPDPEPMPTLTTPGPALQEPPTTSAGATDTEVSAGAAGEPDAPLIRTGGTGGARGFHMDGGTGEVDTEADGSAVVEDTPAANDGARTRCVLCPLAFLATAVAVVRL